MANSILTTQVIARQALPILRENLVFPALVHGDYSQDFCHCGDEVLVRKPAVFTAKDFTDTIETQDVSEGSVSVRLDRIADVSVELSAKEMALSISDFGAQVLEPAMVALAEKINSDGMALYADVPYTVGTAGTTPAGLADFAAAAKALNGACAPMTDRSAIWDIEAIAAFQKQGDIVNADKSGDTKALREGSIGKLLGFGNYMSQAVKAHKSGTMTDGKLAAAGTAGDTAISVSGSGTLVKGDVITIDGESYAVAADAVGAGSAVDVELTTPLRRDAGSGAAVAVTPDHTANLAFHKNAFAFITRPLEPARGADSYVTGYGGLTLRVTMGYDMTYKKQILSIDTLYGVRTMYPELAVRVLG